ACFLHPDLVARPRAVDQVARKETLVVTTVEGIAQRLGTVSLREHHDTFGDEYGPRSVRRGCVSEAADGVSLSHCHLVDQHRGHPPRLSDLVRSAAKRTGRGHGPPSRKGSVLPSCPAREC